MELRDLKSFVVLGELLHFSHAAQRLHITQSALSKQIRRLEEELGSDLFERNASGTRLTKLGQVIYQDALLIVEKSEQLIRTTRDIRAGIRGSLRIGFGISSKNLVPVAISRFREEHPYVRIELCDMATEHQLMALESGKLDVGFCRLPAIKGWPALPVIRAHFVAVLPASYPKIKDLAELTGKPLVIIQRSEAPSFHDHLMNYLSLQGLHFSETHTVSDFFAAVALAAAGIGWAIVPSSTAIEHPMVRTLMLDAPEASWTIGLVRPEGPADPLIESFWSIVAELSEVDA